MALNCSSCHKDHHLNLHYVFFPLSNINNVLTTCIFFPINNVLIIIITYVDWMQFGWLGGMVVTLLTRVQFLVSDV
jgi:hypothetical protein